jgi:hypothetical protein
MLIKEEVAVIGGGPAGIVAAIAAARAGAKVALIERNPFVGGSACLGLVIHGFFNSKGEHCINGIPREILERLKKIGGAVGPVDIKNGHTPKLYHIHGDLFQILVLDMLKEQQINLYLNTSSFKVLMDGPVIKKIKLFIQGETCDLEGKIYIDCTGNADIFAQTGLPFEKGRPSDGLLQPMGQLFRLGNVDIEKFLDKAGLATARAIKPGEIKESVVWFSASLSPWNDIITSQKLFIGENRIFWGNSIMGNEYNINISRIAGLDGTKPEDMRLAQIVGKEQVFQSYRFFKEHVDGFENCFLSNVAPFIGIRETRRIVGEYQLTLKDFLEERVFDDMIASSGGFVDIHDPKGGPQTELIQVGGRGYRIPYRCLYNKQCENLLVAGRPISTSHEVHGATRLMATCMATGQAAGVAAEIAARQNISVGNIDIQELQGELREQNAML